MERQTTTRNPGRKATTRLVLAQCISLALAAQAGAQGRGNDARLDQLEQLLREQSESLEDLRETVREQEREIDGLRRALAEEQLEDARALGGNPATAPVQVMTPQGQMTVTPPMPPGAVIATQGAAAAAAQQQGQGEQATPPAGSPPGTLPPAAATAQADPSAAPQAPPPTNGERRPVGQAPAEASRPPEVAQIFQQPGVLTPRGTFTLEPSFQYTYYTTDRVALIGYTVIPAILIGLIDVRQVKTTTTITTLTGRYGLSDRWEIEAKVPYVNVTADTISREIFTGTAVDSVFNANGGGLGDVEVTARYQLNRPKADRPYYVGWLRYKSRTGKDLFEVPTDCVQRCVANATGTGLPLEVPTGSGFESIQPGVTWLFPSDPVVFFGSFSYLYNFPRKNVSRTLVDGTREPLGEVKAGNVFGLNIGMGLALNEKASISIGYDQNIVSETKQNDVDSPGSVRTTLATMLLGGTYRFRDNSSMNIALGAGVTRDSPDVSLTLRYSKSF